VDVLYQYAIMISDLSDEVSETDANPILVYEEGKGVKVVDARIILKKKAQTEPVKELVMS
jgi:acetyltransferase